MVYRTDFIDGKSMQSFVSKTKKSYVVDKKINCKCLPNAAIIVPNLNKQMSSLGYGGVLCEGTFYPELDFFDKKYPSAHVSKKSNDSVIFLGCINPYWGHCITDALKRLWFIYTDIGKRCLQENVKIVYTVPKGNKLPDFGREILSMADVDLDKLICITESTLFSQVYLPEDSLFRSTNINPMNSELYVTKEFKLPIERIKSNLDDGNIAELPARIFLTRGLLSDAWMRETGEFAIAKIFKKIGYCIIAPERLNVKEQLRIFANCTEFVATQGTLAHNAIFCSNKTKVVILRKADFLNSYQLALNELFELDVVYIDTNASCPPYDGWGKTYGPHFLCVTSHLMSYLNESCLYLPYWLQLSYWLYRLKKTSFWSIYFSNRRIIKKVEQDYSAYSRQKYFALLK